MEESKTSPEKPLQGRPKPPNAPSLEEEFPPPPDDMVEEHNELHGEEEQKDVFSDSDISNLKEIFQLFDSKNTGRIPPKDFEAILVSLKRDPEEGK